MPRFRINQLHALFIGIILTPLENLLCQLRHRKNIDIFIAVRIPELRLLHQHILLGMHVKPAVCHKWKIILPLLIPLNIKIRLISFQHALQQFLSGLFLIWHLQSPFLFLRVLPCLFQKINQSLPYRGCIILFIAIIEKKIISPCEMRELFRASLKNPKKSRHRGDADKSFQNDLPHFQSTRPRCPKKL